jgi:hypothetical protein
MKTKKSMMDKIQGWLPKEPSFPIPKKIKLAEMKIRLRPMMEWERKAFKITSKANAIMVGAFLGTHFLIDPYNRSSEVAIISWSIFVPSLILVNLLLYRFFKKKAKPAG